MGWSSLCRSRRRCLTSPVAPQAPPRRIHCRRCSWPASALSCESVSTGFHLRGLDRSAPTLAGTTHRDRNAFGRVTHGPGVTPRRRSGFATFTESSPSAAHRFHPGTASPACVSTPWRAPRGQRRLVDSPCGSSTVPARDASDRPLPSHFFVRAPVPHRFPVRRGLAPTLSRGSPAVTSERFASAGRTRVFLCTSTGVFFPPGFVRPSLWHPCRVPRRRPLRSRMSGLRGSCRGYRTARPREGRSVWSDGLGCLSSDKDLCPATPSRAPGSGLCTRCGLAAAPRAVSTFSHATALAGPREPDPRPRFPLPAGMRFSGSRRCLSTSAT
jgi:hypothetical protein